MSYKYNETDGNWISEELPEKDVEVKETESKKKSIPAPSEKNVDNAATTNAKMEKQPPKKQSSKLYESNKFFTVVNGAKDFTHCRDLNCSMFQNDQCGDKTIEKCKCNKPEFLFHFTIQNAFGVCKNCGHIIYNRGGKIAHYARAYRCGYPYYLELCEAPKSLKGL